VIVDGVGDRFSCAPDSTDCSSAAAIVAVAAEQPFCPGTRVDAVVIPDAGHAIDLYRSAQTAYCHVIEWLDRYVRIG